jgi:hypothetical protein
MDEKYVRNDDPVGERGAHGSRWTLASGQRGDNVEVYGVKHQPGCLRISVTDFRSGTNTPSHGCICMDLESSLEFAAEIVRLVHQVRQSISKD